MTISNTKQKVSDEYRNNPFWDGGSEEVLDFEQELVKELYDSWNADDTVLLDALEHLGWTKLVRAYEEVSPDYG